MIRPMRSDEFDAFYAKGQEVYVGDMVRAGLDPEVARAKSDADHQMLFPSGFDSPDQLLYVIEDDGAPAGFLWLCDRDSPMGRHLFVYGLEVDEEHRGKGLGREAMVFAEEEARRLGLTKVALNVFGGNDAARGLYRSLGYAETAIAMTKRV